MRVAMCLRMCYRGHMAQPTRADEKSLKVPVAFRVTQAEQDDIDKAAEILGAELPERSRGAALRHLAHLVANGALILPLSDNDRAALDRLVEKQAADLARIGVHGMQPTPASVLLSLVHKATQEAPAPVIPVSTTDVQAFVAAAPVHEAAVREVAAREGVAVTPAPIAAEHEPTPAMLQDALTAAMEATETAGSIATAIGITASAIRGFKSKGTGLGAERRAELAAYLREKGFLKDAP